jgi:hypothetical protein
MTAVAAPWLGWPGRRWIAEALLLLLGLALVRGAILADQAWFDRHFLPVFFVSRPRVLFGRACARLFVASLGLILALIVRPWVGRGVERRSPAELWSGAARMLLAVVLAAGVSELALRAAFSRATEEAPPNEEPLRRHDTRLGWVFVPSRIGHIVIAGRPVDYAFDAGGFRVPVLTRPVDRAKPTIVFSGESIITGFGLRWDETIPARVGAAMGLQSANLSVFGYADDQAYMRLGDELPKFARPRAVVMLFSPGLFFRDFDDDRPHLDDNRLWRPAVHRPRLIALLRFFAPYKSGEAIDAKIAQAHAQFAALVEAAHGRGAAALIVVPRFGREDPTERVIRQRVLAGLPSVTVELDPRLRLPHDPHPNAEGARLIAAAITGRLTGPDSPRPPAVRSR